MVALWRPNPGAAGGRCNEQHSYLELVDALRRNLGVLYDGPGG